VQGHEVCFYTDYEGVVIFKDPVTGEETPAYRKLDNANLGCFDFAVAETGDFEMRVDRNVTVAPIAEIMTSGEVGAGVLQTQTETVTRTITVPVSTYTTVIGGATQTVTEYRTITRTSVDTRVVTTTITIEKTVTTATSIIRTVTEGTTITRTVTETRTITNTVTKTVTASAGGGGSGSALYNSTVTVLEDGARKPKTLDEVSVGDLVLTDKGFLRVAEKREIMVDNLYTIRVEGGYVLRADDAQPILTKNGVKRVGQLAVGDEVYTVDDWRSVQSIDVTRFDKPTVKVIDLRFERFAFYYVDGVLVEDYKAYSGVILIQPPYDAFIFIGRG
jgi:hypothetical protein